MGNNKAELLLKSVVIHRKSGQAFRSEKAMEEYGILLTVLNTWKEKGLNNSETLQKLILRNMKTKISYLIYYGRERHTHNLFL